MNFDGVWPILNNSVPPEITHYQNGSHPGKTWWLKTVVPSWDNHIQVCQAWRTIEQAHKKIVRLVPHAYDWAQNVIPHAHSVWISHKADVSLTRVGDGYEYSILDYDHSFNEWGAQLQMWLSSQPFPESKENDVHGWHKLWHITELVKTWTTDKQAQVKRRNIKVVKSEKCSGPAHNGPELDSN